ncbi:mucoidy inhibitor MuiA family protein [Nannocystaceae bacterium ST9]
MSEPAMARSESESEAGVRTLSASVPVVEVTLLEDRALVVRRGTIDLPPGRSRLRLEGVAPVLVDKTLTASLRAREGEAELPEGVRVRDAKLARVWVTTDAQRPEALVELIVAQRAKQAERKAAHERRVLLDRELASLASLNAQLLHEIAEDVGWAKQESASWAAQLDQLDQRQHELGEQRCVADQAIARLDRDLRDLQAGIEGQAKLESSARAAIELELINAEPLGRSVELRVDYLVPGALWRPWHTARLIEGEGKAKLEFRCEGCVWQSTGEDWHDAQLVFSTERPSLGVAPPLLQTDTLRVRKKGATVEVQTRDQKIHTAGLGAGESEGGSKQVAQDDLPGIDDGGEALLLRGLAKASVPSDGKPYRVPIFEFESAAETALVCTPELVAAVLLRSRQTNQASHPLLAGPVDLVRHSGLVGRTSILFIAPGERFELGWGPDSSLRVHRSVELLVQERKTLSSWTRKPRKVEVKLSNLGPEPRTLEVKERIAVSEVEKVEVELVDASRKAKPDKDGFVTWEVRLPGFGHEELLVHWTLVVHDDVVGL